MERLTETTYIKTKATKQWLLSHDFHYNRLFSDEETEVYTYRFPVYKYEKFTVLDCELRITLGEDNVKIDVYDYGTINKYAPFYYCEYGNYDKMVKEIWTKINKTLKKLDIKRKKRN